MEKQEEKKQTLGLELSSISLRSWKKKEEEKKTPPFIESGDGSHNLVN